MGEINKFKDITDEELEALIKERQLKNPAPKKLSNSQLVNGLGKRSKDTSSNKIIEYVCSILRFLLIVPNIAKFAICINEYNHYAEIFKNVINTNDKFFDFLEKYKFYPVRFTRLMSVQPIPEELINLTDEELLAITIRSLLPIKKMVEETRLLEIVSIKIMNRKVNTYAIILEPKNFEECESIFKSIVYSIMFYIGILVSIFIYINYI